jgi:hypothetical protein
LVVLALVGPLVLALGHLGRCAAGTAQTGIWAEIRMQLVPQRDQVGITDRQMAFATLLTRRCTTETAKVAA